MPIRKTSAAARGLLWVLSCALCASSGRAQTAPGSALPEQPVVAAQAGAPEPARAAVLALEVAADLVDPAALRAALEAELGVGVLDAAYATAGMPTLHVSPVGAGNVEVALTSQTMQRASREIALTAQRPEERVQIVAFIASNLVRNEAAALLPALQPSAPSAPSAPPPPAPRVVSPCDDLNGEAELGLDIAPGLGSSSTARGRAATRRLSLGLAGTLSSRLHGLEFSFGASMQRISVCGGQFAIGTSITHGPVTGLQGAVYSTARGFEGVQAGIVAVNRGEFEGTQGGVVSINVGNFVGAQGGIVTLNTRSFHGMQGGIATFAGGGLTGVQGGVTNLSVGRFVGLQGGVVNVNAGDLYGLQGGVANTIAGQVIGAQLGVANYAGGVNQGAQVGVVNISAGTVRGTQVGLLNYADSADLSLGLLSIVRHGRTSIDMLAAAETAALTFGVTHGGKYVHNSFAIGPRFSAGNERGVATLGLGVRVLSKARLRIDIDLVSTTYLSKDMGRYSTNIAGLRVPVTLMLVGGFGVVAAASYQIMVTDDPDPKAQSIFGDQHLYSSQDVTVIGYPGLILGLRYEFDHGLSARSGQASWQ